MSKLEVMDRYYLEEDKAYQRMWLMSIRKDYKGNVKKVLDITISLAEFIEERNKLCFYCNTPPPLAFEIVAKNGTYGLDRYDNDLGYTFDNIRACCPRCNTMKGILHGHDFIEQCVHITNYTLYNKRTVPYIKMSPMEYYEPRILRKNRKPFGIAARNFIYDSYKQRARKLKREFNLTMDEFIKIVKGTCTYCGINPSNLCHLSQCYGDFVYNGIDRVDSSLGYTYENGTTCCRKCNVMKTNIFSLNFIRQARKIANYRPNMTNYRLNVV